MKGNSGAHQDAILLINTRNHIRNHQVIYKPFCGHTSCSVKSVTGDITLLFLNVLQIKA